MWDYNKKWLKEKHHKECAAQLAKRNNKKEEKFYYQSNPFKERGRKIY